MKILVTGAAGFIGFHLVKQLVDRGDDVLGLDNISDYYDLDIKYGRLKECGIEKEAIKEHKPLQSTTHTNFRFVKTNLEDKAYIEELFAAEKFDVVVNLAAQAGVRYSLTHPDIYIKSNIEGFLNILEGCRHTKVPNFVYASSSSVYGSNTKMPFSVQDTVDHPVSLYAASKKANELMAHTYSHLFNIPATGLRFFTVYGPWGRPDMALFLFTKAIMEGKPIQVFNNGQMVRDFTYVGDIVKGVISAIDNPAKPNEDWDGKNPDAATSKAPYRLYNIGNSSPVKLIDFIGVLEKTLGKEAIKDFMPIQAGDVAATWADIEDIKNELGFNPNTPLEEGIANFVQWYKEFYNI